MVRKWLKIGLLLVAIGLLAMLVLTATSYYLLTGTPDWYHPGTLSESDRRDAANRAIQKYASIQSWAADVQAAEARRERGNTTTRYAPVDDELSITFSQEEINGFVYSWSQRFGWDQWYGRYVKDPVIVLQEGRLVVAGKLKDYDAVASFHFQPSLDEQGRLHLDLVRVLGGKLPLPQSLWSSQREKLESALRHRLPAWRRGARLSPSGVANDDAVYGGLASLALSAMAREGGEPVIFLWITHDFSGGRHEFRRVPVKLTDVAIDDHLMRLTVQRLDRHERADYLERLRHPIRTASAERIVQ